MTLVPIVPHGDGIMGRFRPFTDPDSSGVPKRVSGMCENHHIFVVEEVVVWLVVAVNGGV